MSARPEQEGFLRVERALAYLGQHHDRVADGVARAKSALLAADLPESARVAQFRWEIIRALREYQSFKQREIFDPLLRTDLPALRVAALVLKARGQVAVADHDEHVRRWTLFGILNDWPGYRRESLLLFDRLERHLAEQLGAIETLLTGLERLR